MIGWGVGVLLHRFCGGGTLYVHKIIGRVGHIRAFAVFAAMAAIVSLMYPMAVSTLFWAVLRVLSGFSVAGGSGGY